ncbi:MAG: TVP38/TMEM64 family protein [Deltaproteobacteria bacterium]|nr:TVP38/TMEM64 family protein [Deltaproteobacteria bacterium]
MEENPSEAAKKSGIWRPVLLIAVVVSAVVLLRFLGVAERLGDLKEWIRGVGSLAPLVFILVYIIAVVAALPALPFTITGAALFGSVTGVILVSIASTAGAGLAFLVARYAARERMVRRFSGNETFRKLDRMTKEHGAVVVAITRLVPIFPFNLLNYGFGLTAIPFRTYLLWSWLCMLPGTVLYVVGVDAVVSGLSPGRIPWPLIAVAAAAAVILIFLVNMARRRLRGRKPEDGGPGLP